MPSIFPNLTSHGPFRIKPRALVFIEWFVAVSLSVTFFFLAKSQCVPKERGGNILPAVTFCWLAPNFGLSTADLPQFWWTRVAAPAMSSRLVETRFDYPINFQSEQCKNLLEVCKTSDFQNLFGLYHAGWLFLTFLLLSVFRRDALLIILGVFAGLMYNLTGPSGCYYFPWDMPTLFFFTLACLLFDRGRIWPLLPVIWLGGLIKETTLCCALFVLLGGHWNWWKRLGAFLAVVIATFATNRLLLAHYGVIAPMFAMNNAKSLTDLIQHTLLPGNLDVLFSLDLNHILFANAGSLFLMMLIPWRNRRDVVFKVVIIVFAIGQFLYGIVNEFRVWYELLPLGWMLIAGAITGPPFASDTETAEPPNRRFKQSYWITMGALLALALVLWVALKHAIPPAPANTQSPDEVLRQKIAAAEAGDVAMQFDLGQTYQNAGDYEEAVKWYRRAVDAGNVYAEVNLGLLYLNVLHDNAQAGTLLRRAADRGHRVAQYFLAVMLANGLAGPVDHEAAHDWLVRSAQQEEVHAQFALGRICQQTNASYFDMAEAYKWLKLAQLGGNNQAGPEIKACSTKMTAEQIAEGEKRAEQFRSGRKD